MNLSTSADVGTGPEVPALDPEAGCTSGPFFGSAELGCTCWPSQNRSQRGEVGAVGRGGHDNWLDVKGDVPSRRPRPPTWRLPLSSFRWWISQSRSDVQSVGRPASTHAGRLVPGRAALEFSCRRVHRWLCFPRVSQSPSDLLQSRRPLREQTEQG